MRPRVGPGERPALSGRQASHPQGLHHVSPPPPRHPQMQEQRPKRRGLPRPPAPGLPGCEREAGTPPPALGLTLKGQGRQGTPRRRQGPQEAGAREAPAADLRAGWASRSPRGAR